MVANNGGPQTTESSNPYAMTPESHNVPFMPRSSGSYTSSNVFNCSNGSDSSSSAMFQHPGSCTSTSRVVIPGTSSSRVATPVYSANSFPPTSTLSRSCQFNTTVNVDIPSLHKSSGANYNSTVEDIVPALPHSSGSCTKSTTSTLGGNICRICHEGEADEKLVSPCLCAGTQGLIHKTCLERWLSTASYDKCELCHFPFHLKKKPRSFFEFLCHKWEPDMRRAIAGDLLCFLVLTPLTLVSAYLCGRGAIQYFTDREYYDSRNSGSNHNDVSIFSSPFTNRYHERPIPREQHVVLKTTSFGATYIEEDRNFDENQIQYNSSDDFEVEPLYMEASGLLILALMLLVIYSCWLAIAVRYHVKAFRRWQHVHQDLVLVDTSNPGPICRLNLSFISSNSPPQIYTLPESSYVDLDERREQRMSLVPEVHSGGRRTSIFSRSRISSAGDSGRKTSIFSRSRISSTGDSGRKTSLFRNRTASECVRRLSESGCKSSLLIVRRASEGGRRASIFSSCFSPTRAGYEELSGKNLLDTSKKVAIKKYAGVNSLNVTPSKKYLDDESPPKKCYGATQSTNEEAKASNADTNNLPAAKETRVFISPVTRNISLPICLEDYESPESYRIACAMYAEALYKREISQMNMSPQHCVGIDQFPFSPTRFNQHRRDSSRSTHF